MEGYILEIVLEIVVTIVLFSVLGFLGFIARRRNETQVDGTLVLAYNWLPRGLSLLCIIIASIPLVWMVFNNDSEDFNDFLTAFILISVVATGLSIEAFGTRVLLSSQGIGKVSWWSWKRKFIRWEDVDRIYREWSFRVWDEQIIVTSRKGSIIRFQTTYMGPLGCFEKFGWFEIKCREHLASESLPEWVAPYPRQSVGRPWFQNAIDVKVRVEEPYETTRMVLLILAIAFFFFTVSALVGRRRRPKRGR